VSEFKLAPTTRPKPLRRKTREERAEVRTTKERNLLLAGTILAIGVQYDNRFCSIIKIENRRIAHWRDYMDSLAAWNALTLGVR